MAEQLKWLGLPVAELFEQADILFASLANPRLKVPQNNISRLWRGAEQASAEEAVGLLVGRELGLLSMPGAMVGLLESQSAVAAINLIMRYQKVIGETSNIRWGDPASASSVSLYFAFYDDQQPLSPHTIDVAMASITRVARLIEGSDWTPQRVELTRPIKDKTVHREYYDCCVRFGAPHNVLWLVPPSEEVRSVASKTRFSAGEGRALADMVAMVLPEQLRMGAFQRKHIAALFSISEKTLQRRLAAEGRRFSDIVDEVRASRSEALLLGGDYSQMEVAFLCGFSDPSAFHHAFKRWFGMSPGAFVKVRR
jgi:AraC-like DNA-binding protein